MNLQPQDTLAKYLESSQYIDWQDSHIYELATSLAQNSVNKTVIAKNCFEFVRDEIEHSVDYQRHGISCKASQVLANGHGFCYAKSHLLVALLRANEIPAGLCYQRLTLSDCPEEGEPLTYSLHGLVAVYLPEFMESVDLSNGWYRIDPRGNKLNVDSQFTPPVEQLAYAIKSAGEMDFSQILAEPLPCVVDVLNNYADYQDIVMNLPDEEELN